MAPILNLALQTQSEKTNIEDQKGIKGAQALLKSHNRLNPRNCGH
jgi:hypothetical protein